MFAFQRFINYLQFMNDLLISMLHYNNLYNYRRIICGYGNGC